jgi:hypothetical protein
MIITYTYCTTCVQSIMEFYFLNKKSTHTHKYTIAVVSTIMFVLMIKEECRNSISDFR